MNDISPEILDDVKAWFKDYVAGFIPGDVQNIIRLQHKVKHSLHVADNCRTLTKELHWSENEIISAEILGMLHDIGQFPKYIEYKGFMDLMSLNHGDRGYRIVRQSSILSSLSPHYSQSILDGILYHNRREIPQSISPESLSFVKIVRDADKLDKFEAINSSIKNIQTKEGLTQKLTNESDGPVKPRLINEIRKNRTVSRNDVTSQLDLHLMRLSWVFDVNYRPTFRHIYDSKVLENIVLILPDDEILRTVSESILDYCRAHALI